MVEKRGAGFMQDQKGAPVLKNIGPVLILSVRITTCVCVSLCLWIHALVCESLCLIPLGSKLHADQTPRSCDRRRLLAGSRLSRIFRRLRLASLRLIVYRLWMPPCCDLACGIATSRDLDSYTKTLSLYYSSVPVPPQPPQHLYTSLT
jgi:hypothetical protein